MLAAVGRKYGVDPTLLAGIAERESSMGTTNGRFTNNAWGYGVHLGPNVNTSRNWQEGATKVARALSGSLYKGSGLTNAGAIIQKYAPRSDGNDPAGYSSKLAAAMRRMGGNPDNVFGNADSTALPTDTASPDQGGQNENAAQTGGDENDSIAAALLSREPGDDLFKSVMQGVLSSALSATGAPSFNERDMGTESGAPLDATGEGNATPVGAAKRYLGTPYSWGGGTPSGPTKGFGRGANTTGFDCSSLVQMAWSKAGVKLPRVTDDQIKVGQGVDPKNMSAWRPGDLVFPSTRHVQMYIGNGKVIEAPRTGGHVQIADVRSTNLAVRRPG
ncbi:MAG: NlpC/P60 family protein [Rhodococcus sp.]|nr:NlpC/P60 family protein [Rhodococcus sp. (in: high G+C Gram-positive bacteria)]